MSEKNKGFTLAELLIVVAIIAVLVAISIPIFSSQLEKSREAVDLANVRSAYAEISAAVLTEDHTSSSYNALQKIFQVKVPLVQKQDGWTTPGVLNVGGISSTDSYYWQGIPGANGTCTVYYDEEQEKMTINWSGYTLVTGLQWKMENGKLKQASYSEVNSNWVCNALSNMINTKSTAGQTMNIKGISETTSPNMKAALDKGYTFEIGIYLTDADGNIIVDSGGRNITGSDTALSVYPMDYKNQSMGNTSGSGSYQYGKDFPDGEEVKIAVQFFKCKPGRTGSVALTAAEAQEFENLISLSSTR